MPVWEGREHKWAAGTGAALRLLAAQAPAAEAAERATSTRSSSATRATSTCPPPGVPPRGRPVVFNPLLSLEDTLVDDRGRFRRDRCPRASSPRSTGARCARPISSSRTPRRTPTTSPAAAGSRTRRWRSASSARRSGSSSPAGSRREPFVALFVGKLIPLHGVETVLEAARLAPELRFRIVGSGQRGDASPTRPANVEWVALGRVRAPPCRAARRRLRTRDLRHLGEGRARDPEQGLPGARLRNAAGHGGHARRARAARPTASARCSSRPATRRRSRRRPQAGGDRGAR